MKNIFYILLVSFVFITVSKAENEQDVAGNFKTYLAYHSSQKIAEGNNLVYAVTNGSLLSYNKTDNSITTYSRQTGLSDNGISQIAYNSSLNTLLIIYTNGNIDLLGENGSVYNISHLLNSTNFNNKTVNNIDINSNIAYLSMQFGVLALDMKKKEIKDTYRIINNPVYSVSTFNNELYATTSEGLYKASINSNLVDINNWSPFSVSLPELTDTIIKTVVFDNKLCFLIKNKVIKGIFYRESDGTVKSLLQDNTLVNLKVENEKLIAHSKTKAFIFFSLSNSENISGSINDIAANNSNNTYWIAADTSIIKGIKKNNAGSYDAVLSEIKINGPRDNNYFYMTSQGNKLLTVGGGFTNNRLKLDGKFSIYEDGNWFNFNTKGIQHNPKDFTSVVANPIENTTYYIASYGEGLLEIKENKINKLYTKDNSLLESATTSNPYNYIRISGLAFDKDNNLWMTNVETNSPIKVLKADGTWAKLSFKSFLNRPQIMDKIIVTSKGHKWLNFPSSDNNNNKPGLFVFKDNDFTEDETNTVFLSSLRDLHGEDIGASSYRCMVEDKKGNLWVGTNKGPIYTPVPFNALENPDRFYFVRITRTNEYGDAYHFLSGDQVNTIAVDGGNRKWIGTESSGVFLVSEDGMETIYNFTIANSPILSNKIISLAINDQTGEVFIGTDKGLVSFMGEGTEGKESFSDVSVYPNPVRPEYEDKVTITGLMTDSNVKITDVSGNLIYQAKSVGGQLIWNCRNHRGSRVATGIYLIIAASPDGGESVVSKVMVIK